MKNKEIKKLTKDQLTKQLDILKKDLFNLRFRKANGQFEDTAKVSQTKREVAKFFTALEGKKQNE